MRARMVMALFAAFVVVDLHGMALQQPTTPLTVISARRANAFSSPTRTIKARDEVADVVIVLRLGGLSREEFLRVGQDGINVLAGDEKLPPNVVATGEIDGRPELIVVCVGPRDVLDMSVVVGPYPPVRFTAEQAVADELR
jgi:hypothetical protein